MALKKIVGVDFFLYAVITKIEFTKNNPISFTVALHKKNTLNEVLEVDNIRYVLPENFDDYFSAEALSVKGMNPHKAIYSWIKKNKPLFYDWEDC